MSKQFKLTAQNVNNVFLECLANKHEEMTVVEGVKIKAGFNLAKIKENHCKIHSMLECLDDNFFAGAGGGWTFLKICADKHGTLWTGDHSQCDRLICLGIAANLLTFTLPRDLWSVLPGEMPYITVYHQANSSGEGGAK